ncbi:DUF262 domain-containing protein [Streptomyces violaceus]
MATAANAFSIGSILSAPDALVVPRVQRPYSWESTETKELWDDLIEFHKRYPGNTIKSREYFMGAIVGQRKNDDDGSFVEILDGQQRLATLTILLSVLRDQLHSENPSGAHKIQIGSIEKLGSLDGPAKYQLTLNKIDRAYFRQEIQEYPGGEVKESNIASHILIKKAKDFFNRKFTEFASEEKCSTVDFAHRLYGIVTQNLRIVFIESDNWDDVSDIFERLNDRGKGLSTLNLLRNHVIAKSPVNQQDDIEYAWEQVYSLSNSASKVDTFLRHVWITYRGDVKKQSLFKEIKAVMASPDAPERLRDPFKFSYNLASDAETYKRILASQHEDAGCARWLRAIQTLGATSLLPATLSACDDWLDVKSQDFLLRALVVTFVRHSIIAGGDSSTLETAVYKVARDIRHGCSLEVALGTLRPLLRSDKQIEADFSTLSVPNSKSGYQRHILEELENHMSAAVKDPSSQPEKGPSGSSVLWIEHIYPQRPGKKWERWKEHEMLVNRIGNLTLVHNKLNASASNKPFDEKVDIYRESHVQLNAGLATFRSWTPQSVQRRQVALAKMAPQVWPRF